jgi:hypothetical protein
MNKIISDKLKEFDERFISKRCYGEEVCGRGELVKSWLTSAFEEVIKENTEKIIDDFDGEFMWVDKIPDGKVRDDINNFFDRVKGKKQND